MIWNRLREAFEQVAAASDHNLRATIAEAFALLCGGRTRLEEVAPLRGLSFELSDGSALFGHVVCELLAEPPELQAAGDTLAHFAGARLEAARLRSEATLLRLVIDSAEVVLTVADTQRRIVFGNAGLVRFSGYTLEEFNAIPPSERIHADDFARVEQARHANLRGEVTRIRWRLLGKEGRIFWVESSAQPVLGDNGKVERIVHTSRDVTAEVDAVAALHRSEERYRLLAEHEMK